MGAGPHNWWNDLAIFKAIAPHKRFAFMQRPELIIQRCSYLEGLSDDEQIAERGNTIKIQQDGISLAYFGSAYPKVLVRIRWSEIAGLEVQDDDEVEDQPAGGRRPREGVLSRTSKQKAGAILQVTTANGNAILFRIMSMTSSELSEALAPLIHAIDLAQQPTQPAPVGPHDDAAVSDKLRELWDLHEQGALTDEEFAAAKQRVLEP